LYRFFADSFDKGILLFDFHFLIWYRFRTRLIVEIERESGVPAARALQLNVGNLRTVWYIYLAVDWLTFDGLPVLGLVSSVLVVIQRFLVLYTTRLETRNSVAIFVGDLPAARAYIIAARVSFESSPPDLRFPLISVPKTLILVELLVVEVVVEV
jgi:hypothetical protein